MKNLLLFLLLLVSISAKVQTKEEDKGNSMRVLKAIMHLAKFSGAKENKQTF